MTRSRAANGKPRNARRTRSAKQNWLYTADDLIRRYGICRNTVGNWVAAGLRYIESEPRLFLGEDLNAFHAGCRQRRLRPLGPVEVYCVSCKLTHSFLEEQVEVGPVRPTGNYRVTLVCPTGGKRANRYLSSAELSHFQDVRKRNPRPETPDDPSEC